MSNADPSENSMEEEEEDYEDLICEYCDKEFTTTKDRDLHKKSCKANIVEKTSMKKTSTKQKTGCLLCGGIKHLSSDCYLTRHESN